MKASEKRSSLFQYIGLICFLLMSLGALLWFGIVIVSLTKQLFFHIPIVTIKKGGFYLLGAGITLGALTCYAAFELLKKSPVPDRAASKIIRTAIAGLILAFLLPHVIHYPVAYYLETKSYQICHEASKQWRLNVSIVYTLPGECEKIAAEKNRKKWDLEDD